jgi:hypothetical protein
MDEIDEWDGEIEFKDLEGEIVQFMDSGKVTGSRTRNPVVLLEKWGKNTGATRIGKVYKVHPRKGTVNILVPPPSEFTRKYNYAPERYTRVPKEAILQCLKFDPLGGGADRIKIR